MCNFVFFVNTVYSNYLLQMYFYDKMKTLIYYTPRNQYNKAFSFWYHSFCYDNKYYYYDYSSIIWFWQIKHRYLDYYQRIIQLPLIRQSFVIMLALS